MSIKIKLKNSTVKDKAPVAADLEIGEIAINANVDSPAAYIKDSASNIVKLAGKGAIGGTPATESAAGIVELATAAETTTGTDNTRAVHPAGLKVELDKKAPLASPALTGVPTAPTAAAGTNTTQLATTEFVTAAVGVEDLWDRTGTTLSPKTAGDVVEISAGTAALPGLTPVGDPNTGVFAPAADELAISTNGVERLRVTADGKLGVGTINPKELLDIGGEGDSYLRWQRGGAGGSYSNTSGGLLRIGPYFGATDQDLAVFVDNRSDAWLMTGTASQRMILGTNKIPVLTIDNLQNVGIGNDAPTSKLTVKTAAGQTPLQISGPSSEFARVDNNGRLLVGASSTSSSAAAIIQGSGALLLSKASEPTGAGQILSHLWFTSANHGAAASIAAYSDTGTWNSSISHPSKLVFSTTADGSPSAGERMSIKSSGIVNIVNTPTYADNAAATAAGLVAGDIYRKADGTLMVTF